MSRPCASCLNRISRRFERLASVESVTFAEASLEKVAGARSTSRFDVHAIYEKRSTWRPSVSV